jgi:TatD DNase family protein
MGTGQPALVDSHVHLDRYTDEEIAGMVARAEAAGVGRLLTIGVDEASSRAGLRLAAEHPSILAAVGIHPTRLLPLRLGDGGRGGEVKLRALLQSSRPAAIGEVGLDASAPDLTGQQHFLAACLALAEERALPLVLHVVGTTAVHEAALALVSRRPRVRVVAHYFVSGPELARRYLEAGCWISVGRPATRPTETAVREAVPLIPLDRLLLETDTYPLPGRTTEPRDVVSVCVAVAELTGRSYAEVATATTTSFAAFIGQ